MNPDPIMDEIMAAIAVVRGGDRLSGRSMLEAIWVRIAEESQAIHECVLAHTMADVQDDIAKELAWDIRALDAALRCEDADAQRHSQALSIAAFMPSLHVNLAEDYLKLDDLAQSRIHLESARASVGELGDDAYAKIIVRGIERLAQQLESSGK